MELAWKRHGLEVLQIAVSDGSSMIQMQLHLALSLHGMVSKTVQIQTQIQRGKIHSRLRQHFQSEAT